MTLHDSKKPIDIFEDVYIFLMNSQPRNTQLTSLCQQLLVISHCRGGRRGSDD